MDVHKFSKRRAYNIRQYLSFQFFMAFSELGLGSNKKERRKKNCPPFFGPL